ncbi:hypothetical protein ABW20_dc0103157 [Dactylellina cionopaga]|nr:hypothetical protein ABW20_dc0103157 [Dactylellina cionopaga]
MVRHTEQPISYADSSEDDASGHSSIFHAGLYFAEEEDEGNEISDKAKQSNISTSSFDSWGAHGFIPPTRHQRDATSDEVSYQPESPINRDAFGTSVDTCSTLVQSVLDISTHLNRNTSDEDDYSNSYDTNKGSKYRDTDTQDAMVYDAVSFEPLFVYTGPKEPTEEPPSMPGPPAQKRAETLAETLFRQDMQTYGLHVNTSTAAMSYFRRSEYHEALRTTEFNFRAIQSQQRAYGDLRNHPFYHTLREDSPLLRSSTGNDPDERRGRRRRQRGNTPENMVGVDISESSLSSRRESSVWANLWEIFCCLAVPTDGSSGDWY